MDYILSAKSSFPSAVLLRNALRDIFGRNFRVTSHPELLDKSPIIRYGCTQIINSSTDTNLNSIKFISTLSNKVAFSNLIKDKVYTPVFSREPPQEKDFPIVVRKYLSACKGKGIVICRNMEEYQKNSPYFWTKFVSLDFELRVHIVGGEVKKVFKKIFTGDEEEEFPIRTSENYHFSLVENVHYPKLKNSLEKLIEILGVENYYAVDIGWDTREKKYFVLEANSAPGLNINTVNIYAEFIDKKLKET